MKNAWRSSGRSAALIIVLAMLAYVPAMRGGFVWDDSLLITDNPMVKAHDGLHRFWFTTEAADYYPLTWSLWWLEWRLWGGNPTGYHVVNVLLHAANAALIWIVLRRLKIPGAWVAAMVFAVHPVNVATVAWISEQKNTLSMLFYAVAILLYLKFDEEDRWPRTSVRGWYGLSLVAFLLALLSKTAVVMLPVVLLGCVWWRRGRVRWKDVLRSVPFFVLSLVMGLVTIWFQHYRAMEGHEVRTEGLLLRLVAAGWVPWFYLYKTLLPWNLMMIYPQWKITASRWISYAPGVILIGCLAFSWWKRRTWGRAPFFGLGYFVVTLFPVLGFFDQSFYRISLVADHWQYCSIVGVIALVVAAGERIVRRMGEWGQPVGVLAGAAVLVVLGMATWRRGCTYATDEILWRDTLAKNPHCWVAHNNLGLGLWQTGRGQEAIEHYEQALRINPDFATAHNNLGLALWQADKVQQAIGHYEQALRIKPDYAEAHNNLGLALWKTGQVREAIEHWEQALRLKPDYAAAHYNWGLALEQEGRMQEAIEHYEQALRLKPDYAKAQNRLARLRAAQ